MKNKLPSSSHIFLLVSLSALWLVVFITRIVILNNLGVSPNAPVKNTLVLFASFLVIIFIAVQFSFDREIKINHLLKEMEEENLQHIKTLNEVNQTLKQEIQIRQQLEQLLRNTLEEAKVVAETDALTGIFNRRAITDFAKREFQRCIKSNLPFSLFMVDMDNLKLINDKYGHDAGDQAILFLAKTLSVMLRKMDGIGRWGGDEFLVVLSETHEETAEMVALRLKDKMNQIFLEEIGAPDINLQISIGISSFNRSNDGEYSSLNEMIKEADEALYQAKEAGKNRVEVYQS